MSAGHLLYRCEQCKQVTDYEPASDVARMLAEKVRAMPPPTRHECGSGLWGVIVLIGGRVPLPPEPEER